ncbi:endonuclease/exonuclease/phosphatase family protein [Kitasatospora sp. NBC_01246]|uniref:endonuclease/exonuclease/phosphatase family protein n=1 Tax=Kitasatospora sp. NBC_01246 TaxID=2903570 RepID=UPI002E33BD4C|nr:endonuclease/exonuclease/phosphatase family protein [Kitasatospora sp. NBC_01246]
MPPTIRIANLNAYKLTIDQPPERWEARATAIKEITPDVLALQEVLVDGALRDGETELERTERCRAEAAGIIERLAADCGLTATTVRADGTSGGIAMANNQHRGWFTAVLWNPDTVRAVPGGFRAHGAPDFWHGFTTIQLDIGAAVPVVIGSYHGDPFRPDFRADEARRLKGALRRTGGAKPGFVLGDFNAISAATITTPDGSTSFYDAEPYSQQDHDDLEYQVLEGTIGKGNLADRRQTEILLRRGFMVDAAAHLGAPWEPTVSHWEDGKGDPDPWGPRRIDLALATRPAAPAVISYQTHRSPAALAASDHLPIIVDVDPAAISRDPEASGG